MTVLNPIIEFLIQSQEVNASPSLSAETFDLDTDKDAHVLCQNLNRAFLILLAGERQAEFLQAQAFLDKFSASRKWKDWARFYLNGAQLIASELEQYCLQDPQLKAKIQEVETFLAENPTDENEIAEKIWSILFPEGVGIRGHEDACTNALKEKRTLTISEFNPDPIQHPAKQILFTANVLLTTPNPTTDLSEYDPDIKTELSEGSRSDCQGRNR